MDRRSQTGGRLALVLLAVVCLVPGLVEGCAVGWGLAHGFVGEAMRDGLDFWAGGFLVLHGGVALLFKPSVYNGFLRQAYGVLPVHMWSYPPNYLLLAAGFGWLPPLAAVAGFDVFGLLLLVWVLRLAALPWVLIVAVAASPASLENLLEGQNAALVTALIGGGMLLLPRRPRLGGVLVGLASMKPQLGVVLPLYLWRRSRLGFAYAVLAACLLAAAALAAFGPAVWWAFWRVTRPAMEGVLTTGQPADFAGGLISVFAAIRPFGLAAAFVVQAAVTLAAAGLASRCEAVAPVLILAALASPYLHDYDLLGVTLAVALMLRERLDGGFAPGEQAVLFAAWFIPGAMPWVPVLAHFIPVLLVLLLAMSRRRGRIRPCDSSQVPPGLPVLSAGR